DEAVAAGSITDRADMREVSFLRVAQVRDEGASGLHSRRSNLEAEDFEGVCLELIEQRATRRLRFESPAFCRGNGRFDAGERHEAFGNRRLPLTIRTPP